MRALQTFSDEYLENCKNMSVVEILDFLEDFRLMHSEINSASISTSIRIPGHLLNAFKVKAKLSGISYQKQIKILMRDWVEKN